MDEIHEMPLSSRLAEDAIREWLDRRTATALAACEPEARQGIEQMRYLHLDDYSYTLVPRILDELKRAGFP